MTARSLQQVLAIAAIAAVAVVAGAQAAAPSPSAPAAPLAPAAPPDSEIFLADLVHEGDAWRVERPRNLTKRVGYDNQPWFLPGGTRLLYTSERGGQSDVYELDLANAQERQVFSTPESEFSPQLGADGESVVVVRVEDAEANAAAAGSAQRLWRFPLRGAGAPELVAPGVRGVGYHAWSDERTVAVFILGDPFTLQLIDLSQADAVTRVIASRVGRSIHRVPGTKEISYTAPDGEARAIFAFDPVSGEIRKVAPAPPTQEGDFAWTPGGMLLAAVGSTIQKFQPGSDTAWQPIADLTGDGVGTISRIAVSPMGDTVAFVATR